MTIYRLSSREWQAWRTRPESRDVIRARARQASSGVIFLIAPSGGCIEQMAQEWPAPRGTTHGELMRMQDEAEADEVQNE